MTSFDYFYPHFKLLSAVGYVSILHKDVSASKMMVHKIYRYIILILVSLCNLQLIIFVYQERHDLDVVVEVMFTLITTLVALAKHVIFFFPHRVRPVIDILKDSKFTADNVYGKKLMDKTFSTMFRLLLFYMTFVILFWIFFFMMHLCDEGFYIPAYFPFDNNKKSTFVLSLLYLTTLSIIQGLGNGTMDIIMISFFAQTKTQLCILRYNLEHIADPLDHNTKIEDRVNTGRNESYDITDECFRELFKSRVIKCLNHYGHIKSFIAAVERFFEEVTTIQVFATSMVIGLSVYKAIPLNIFSTEFLWLAIYLVCIIFQLFMYSYFATQIQDESQYVSQSVYFSQWRKLTPSQCRLLLTMMQFFSGTITIRIAYIIPLSLSTFISVVKASYSLYTLFDRT